MSPVSTDNALAETESSTPLYLPTHKGRQLFSCSYAAQDTVAFSRLDLTALFRCDTLLGITNRFRKLATLRRPTMPHTYGPDPLEDGLNGMSRILRYRAVELARAGVHGFDGAISIDLFR